MFSAFIGIPRRLAGGVKHFFARLGWEFWISNLIILLSTVLGVYLAAKAGLETAVRFENIRTDRGNYYLRSSLREEVRFNVATVDKIIAWSGKWGTYHNNMDHIPKFKFYVYETMQEQEATLETPTRIIIGVQNYYDEVRELLDRADKKLISAPKMVSELKKMNTSFKSEVLDYMDQNLAKLRLRLTQAGVQLE
jgi:hypothetical protein